MSEFSESVAEDATLAWRESLGWTAKFGPEIAPGELLMQAIACGEKLGLMSRSIEFPTSTEPASRSTA